MPRKTTFPDAPNNNGSYRLTVGGKQFQLGTDRLAAKRKFNALEEWWENFVPTNHGVKKWTDDLIQKALGSATPVKPIQQQSAQIVVSTPVVTTQTKPVPAAPTGLMLHQGLMLYRDHMERQFETGDVSKRRHKDVTERMNKIMANILDRPMSEFTSPDSLKVHLRDYWASRPEVTIAGKKGQPPTHRKMGFTRAKDLIAETLFALTWLSQNDHWKNAPTWFMKAFTPPTMTDEEIEAASEDPDAFTAEELAIVFRSAHSPNQKLLVLACLFFGWTQIDIATLKRSHIKERGGEMFIEKVRFKTRKAQSTGKKPIKGSWWVPPEIATLLRKRMEGKTDLLVLTEYGNPLVTETSDAAQGMWKDMRTNFVKNGAPSYALKSLRKTGGQMIENLHSHELTKVFLCHTFAGVTAQHYTARTTAVGVGKSQFERLYEVQKEMYAQLRPHLFPTLAENEAKKTAKATVEEKAVA